MERKIWTREELILAFNLYLKIPFGKMHKTNPDVIHLANIIGRTPSSIAMRLTNFASIDPYHKNRGITGLVGGKKQVQPIWDEFNVNKEELLFESEKILAQKENTSIEKKYSAILGNTHDKKGEVVLREVKTRVNQNIFRQIILNTYSNQCAISGINIPEMLIASHIIPWAKNERERLNPENGICLSSLYDTAYDKGLITIDTSYKLRISSIIKRQESKPFYNTYFGRFENQVIALPERFMPKKEFLEYHNEERFKK